ncbi:MAG TPA: hypothetical protein VII71_04500 [Verrucomicrobiae bacterium]
MNPMNWRAKFSRNAKTMLFYVIFAAGLPVVAAPPVVQTSGVQPPRSIFTLPTNSKEGCDPFFPASLRPYENAVAIGSHAGDLTAVVMQGISGPPNRRLAIINNVTFGVGDEAEVRTPQGRIHIHCLEITANSAVIEAGGQRQELHYGDKP